MKQSTVPYSFLSFPATYGLRDNHRFTRELMELDRQAFGDLDESDEGSEEGWERLRVHRPDSEIIAIDRSARPIGYIDTFPITVSAAHRIRNGTLRDGQFTVDDIPGRLCPSFSLYVMSLVVAPTYQRMGIGAALWNRSMAYWRRFPVAEVLVTLWSTQGISFFSPVVSEALRTDERGHITARLHLRELNEEAPVSMRSRPPFLSLMNGAVSDTN